MTTKKTEGGKITAILELGILKGKMSLPYFRDEIQLAVFLPLKVKYADENILEPSEATPRLVFEWRHQIAKNTHLYTLKEII